MPSGLPKEWVDFLQNNNLNKDVAVDYCLTHYLAIWHLQDSITNAVLQVSLLTYIINYESISVYFLDFFHKITEKVPSVYFKL